MVKRALLIGINYRDVAGATLQGCLNDVDNMKYTLMSYYGFAESDIVVLRDDAQSEASHPTAQNIITNLVDLISNSSKYEEIWIHYSGHGSQIRDRNGDEKSGYDSVIVPADFQSVGVITDDLLYTIISRSKTKTYMLFDSCNSGTVCDLVYSYEYLGGNRYSRTQNNRAFLSNQNIYMISGSKDTQTSADAYFPKTNSFGGAFTTCFLNAIQKNNYSAPFITLYRDTCILLQQQGYSQKPILSCTTTNPAIQYLRRTTAKTRDLRLTGVGAVSVAPVAARAVVVSPANEMLPRVRAAARAKLPKMKMLL